MAIPIVSDWEKYFTDHHDGLGSTYERFIINKLLFGLIKKHQISSVLETPSFGFTGLSGINSLGLALDGMAVTVNDNDLYRLNLIKDVWSRFDTQSTLEQVEDFTILPYKENSFDLSWSFSALWFVSDLTLFCKELDRVTKKVILIMVPNRFGLGYRFQKNTGGETLKHNLKEEYIIPERFSHELSQYGWIVVKQGYIDCPLWPDIGMSKEAFLRKIHLSWLVFLFGSKKREKKSMSILDFYDNTDTQLQKKMSRLEIFEKYLPSFLKRFWAHHRYYIFLPIGDNGFTKKYE